MTAPALILLGLLWLTIITTELVTARVPSSPAEQSPTSSRPCHQLPVSGFLTAQQLDMICHHREQWIKDRDSQSSKAVLEQTTADQQNYLHDLEACTRVNCVEDVRRRRRRKITVSFVVAVKTFSRSFLNGGSAYNREKTPKQLKNCEKCS
ncbi:unnamed protein product [Heligmosomoides polygyrus]|uniref:Secreted protein n=1 Tax=Heligmosomoides polygyrus TaxID=6339 RepID=A0A183GGD3_HELPZ|nr:unnamed protein product [Heligmosomoides polygyrus]